MKNIKQICAGFVLALGVSGVYASTHQNVTLVDSITYDKTSGSINFGPGEADKSAWVQFSTGSLCPSGCSLGPVTLYLRGDDENGVGHGPVADGNFSLEILDDNSGTPGSSIGSLITPQFFIDTAGENLFEAPASPVNLAANTDYWLKFTSITGNDANLVEWLMPSPGVGRVGKYQFDSAFGLIVGDGTNGTAPPPQMKIVAVSNVPLPSALFLMGSALFGLLLRSKTNN